MKYFNLPELLAKRNINITFDGDKTDLRLHIDDNYRWGANVKREYKRASDLIDAIEYKGKGWEIFAWYDVSGFDYWMKQMEETNYIQITIAFDTEDIEDSQLDAIYNALDNATNRAECIAEVYNYDPCPYNN